MAHEQTLYCLNKHKAPYWFVLLCWLASLFILASDTQAQDPTLTLMSFNIRCGYCEPAESNNAWRKRKFLVAHLIQMNAPDIIGLQEAELFQVNDLITMLKDYEWVGVGRDDGHLKGETTAILYRKTRLSVELKQTLWLSTTPTVPSLGWDASYKRTLSKIKLFDNINEKTFFVFNTHFDHRGEQAKTESAKLLIQEVEKLTAKSAILVSGDFNFSKTNSNYRIITESLTDAETTAKAIASNTNYTFNDFGKTNDTAEKIDFIFTNEQINVLTHKVDTTRYNHLYPSDHFPVVIKFMLK
jgi:endonuclease/exonuclease/phosphatase family metal-dependent hydrolase